MSDDDKHRQVWIAMIMSGLSVDVHAGKISAAAQLSHTRIRIARPDTEPPGQGTDDNVATCHLPDIVRSQRWIIRMKIHLN